MVKARAKKRAKKGALKGIDNDAPTTPFVLEKPQHTELTELDVLRNSVSELAQALESTCEAGDALEKRFDVFREKHATEITELRQHISKLEATFGLPGPEGDDDADDDAQGEGETHRPGALSPEAGAGTDS